MGQASPRHLGYASAYLKAQVGLSPNKWACDARPGGFKQEATRESANLKHDGCFDSLNNSSKPTLPYTEICWMLV